MCLLYYYFGTHNVPIHCSTNDFFKLIDDLSFEFQIVKEFHETFVEYFIINYYDERQLIGYMFND